MHFFPCDAKSLHNGITRAETTKLEDNSWRVMAKLT